MIPALLYVPLCSSFPSECGVDLRTEYSKSDEMSLLGLGYIKTMTSTLLALSSWLACFDEANYYAGEAYVARK